MAADEVMLERAAEGESSLRFYTWDPATVSLGYFQKHAERQANPALAKYPWVRRCTGGGAIIHDGDLTYSFALSPAIRAGRPAKEWHDRFHEALADVLQQRRIEAQVQSGPRPSQEQLGYLCFTVPQPGDVILAGRKVIGGAQRLRRGALMQHGSIQLPAVVGQAERLPEAVAAALNWQLENRPWTDAELKRIDALAAGKYDLSAWNEKR
jgi:lipoate-protein ligase A